MKKMTSLFSILMFSAAPIYAAQDCTVARTAHFSTDPIYDVNRSLYNHSYQLALETNAVLFRRGKDQPVYNELVKNVSYVNDSKTMRVELRQNCGWSDGTMITADAVVEGIYKTFSEGPYSSNAGRKFIKNGLEIIGGNTPLEELGVRVIDEHSFEIDILTSGKLMETMLARVNFTPFPIHLSQSEQEKWEEGYLKRLSSGPHYVTSIDENELHLTKNPFFCQDISPEIENLIYYNQGNKASQTGLFLNKKINLAEGLNTKELRILEAGEKVAPFKIRETSGEDITLLLQSANGQFMENRELREAVFLATDLDRFTNILDLDKNFLAQKGAITYPYLGFDLPLDPLFEKTYSERLTQAQEILEKHGFNSENPMTIKIVAVKWPAFGEVEVALRSMWRQIGIETIFEIVDEKDFSWKGLEEWPGGYDYFLVSTRSDYPDPSDLLTWLAIHGADENNIELKDRILESFQMVDNKARLEELKQVELEMRENRAVLSLFASSTQWTLDQSLEIGNYFYLTGINLTSDTCPT